MQRKKTKGILNHLGPAEWAQVLRELLERHGDLREEADEIAASLIADVSVEAIAEEVSMLASSIDIERLGDRAGKHSWG